MSALILSHVAVQNLQQVSEDEVIMKHLFAESKQAIIDCVTNPNLRDPTQNLLRKSMLMAGVRAPIYVPLLQQADGITWFSGKIGQREFRQLKLLPDWDWVALSLGTQLVSITAEHLERDPVLTSQHFTGQVNTVNKYAQNLVHFPFTIIAIATDLNGLWTVIDGVKHSVATYLAFFVRKTISTFPNIDIYVGLCNKKTQWHAP
jgi:hypothetical protein